MTEEQRSGEGEQRAHPTTDAYLAVAGILIIITVVEVGVFYVPAFQSILAPMLLVLSGAKFALVVMFYMHLKKDHGLFSLLFVLPLALAVAVILAMLFLYGVFRMG